MNLIFHMTTHRPRQPQPDVPASMAPDDPNAASAPVKCQDCGKEFATKYQAKKHYLRRHFQGEKPFACTKCNKKRFVVKEDLTMHMKVGRQPHPCHPHTSAPMQPPSPRPCPCALRLTWPRPAAPRA